MNGPAQSRNFFFVWLTLAIGMVGNISFSLLLWTKGNDSILWYFWPCPCVLLVVIPGIVLSARSIHRRAVAKRGLNWSLTDLICASAFAACISFLVFAQTGPVLAAILASTLAATMFGALLVSRRGGFHGVKKYLYVSGVFIWLLGCATLLLLCRILIEFTVTGNGLGGIAFMVLAEVLLINPKIAVWIGLFCFPLGIVQCWLLRRTVKFERKAACLNRSATK